MTPVGPSVVETIFIKNRRYKILGVVTQWPNSKLYAYEVSFWAYRGKTNLLGFKDVGKVIFESGPIATREVAASSMAEYVKSATTRMKRTGMLPKNAQNDTIKHRTKEEKIL